MRNSVSAGYRSKIERREVQKQYKSKYESVSGMGMHDMTVDCVCVTQRFVFDAG